MIHLHAKNYQNIPSSLEVTTSVSVSEKFASARLFIKKSGIRQSHWSDLVNIYLHAKDYQNIPSRLKVILRIQFLKYFALARLFIKKSGIRLSH